MSIVSWLPCVFRCMHCSSDEQMRVIHALPFGHPDRRPISFKAWFWTASTFRGQPLTPTLRDIKCPYCGAHAAWFERYPRACTNFIMPLREELRPIAFRWRDRYGRERFRYPSAANTGEYLKGLTPDADGKYTLRAPGGVPVRFDSREEAAREIQTNWRYNGSLPRPNEEKVDFPTLGSVERFLQEQHPNYRDWQLPLNDLLDYSNPDTAISDDDPGVAAEADDIGQTEDFGILDEAPDPSTIKMSFADGLRVR